MKFIHCSFRAAGGPPLAAPARPELAPLRPRRSPPSRFPRRRGPPVPPRLPPRPAATAMVVSGRGGGGGSGGGDGTRGCRGRGRAARHLPGVRPRGASPARRCESAGGSGGAERAFPCAVQVNAVQAASPGALGRLPLLSVLLPDRTVWQQTRGHSGEADVPREREGFGRQPQPASLRSGSSHRVNWKSGRSHLPGPPPHPLQPPGWGSQRGDLILQQEIAFKDFILKTLCKQITSGNFQYLGVK
ncbi:uncharacterized protein LOC141730464 [Zonotrichia albicollis]|uniref:uncharacterized protein LOC141730464 n=1 Tax=Zonotrichia albicollis TaxID=44394 RepID=UPI003D80D506